MNGIDETELQIGKMEGDDYHFVKVKWRGTYRNICLTCRHRVRSTWWVQDFNSLIQERFALHSSKRKSVDAMVEGLANGVMQRMLVEKGLVVLRRRCVAG